MSSLHHEQQFSKEYISEYEDEAKTPLGRQIIATRWDMVQRHVNDGWVLDYGCGSGSFVDAVPKGFVCHGFDANPYSPYNKCDWATTFHPDILTMWDVIEHLRVPSDIFGLLKHSLRWVFLCTPNIEAAPEDVVSFKHVKPGEHLHYFSRKSLTALLYCVGFEVVEYNFDEGMLRDANNPEAVISLAAKLR
jgi:hypothetical protein